MSDIQLQELQSFAYTPGSVQSIIFQLAGLPQKRRVVAFVLQLDSVIAPVDAGGTSFDANDVIAAQLGFIEHHSGFLNLKATGQTLRQLYHGMRGKAQSDKIFPLIPGNRTVRSYLTIPCADPRALVPYDGAIPSELFAGTTIQVKTTSNSNIGSGNGGTVEDTVLRLFVAYTDADEDAATDPLRTRIDFEDWSGQTVLLKTGLYSHILIMHADGSVITAGSGGDIERVDFQIDNEPVVDNVLVEAIVDDYNGKHVAGGFVDNVREQEDVLSFPFLPVSTPDEKYKVTSLAAGVTADGSKITFEGTDTAVRIVYRIIERKGPGLIRTAAAKQGVLAPRRAVNTASKLPLTGSVARVKLLTAVLPGKLRP